MECSTSVNTNKLQSPTTRWNHFRNKVLSLKSPRRLHKALQILTNPKATKTKLYYI